MRVEHIIINIMSAGWLAGRAEPGCNAQPSPALPHYMLYIHLTFSFSDFHFLPLPQKNFVKKLVLAVAVAIVLRRVVFTLSPSFP